MDIETWLHDLGLERYIEAFRANEIDHEILATLTAEDLSDIGVKIVGHRRKILNAAATLGRGSATAPVVLRADIQSAKVVPRSSFVEAERRHLTVMFIDLVGSTAMSGQLDPEEMGQVLRIYQNGVASEVNRFGGHVARLMGDGVLAYFGFPQAHEDDAERSVRAGLAIMQAVTGMATPLGSALSARIGIATGLVVVGDLIGDGAMHESDIVGETPNLAARLQAHAEPDQIVLSVGTRQLLGDLFEFEDLGTQDLKGIKEPVQTFTVHGERSVESRFAASHSGRLSRMTGRDQELALLIERWRQAKDSEGQFVVLIGEAGIGKSRLTQALIDEITSDQPIRLNYQCSPHHRDSALYPAIQQLSRAADLKPENSAAVKVEKLKALLSRATSDVGESASLIAALFGIHDENRSGKMDIPPQQQRVRTLQVLTEQLISLASQRPVLLIVEDAHWIDPTTLELIERCVDVSVRARVLILMTTRPEGQVEIGGHPNMTSLSLNRLSQQHVSMIIRELLGGICLPEDVLDEIIAKTDGVPLFVEEVAKAVVEEGLLSANVPASLHESLMARLDRIPSAKQIAQIAAVIGREFDFELLRRLSQVQDTELLAALKLLVDAELIFCRGRAPDANYSFKHALVRDAAYESLLREKRRFLHGQIADLLSNAPDNFGHADEALAQHLALAERPEAAIRTWIAAAEQASSKSAYQEALGLVDAAVEFLPRISDQGLNFELDIELELLRAEVLQILEGPSKAAFAAYRRVQKLTHQAGDQQREFVGAWGLWFLDQQSMNLPQATKLAQQLLPLAESAGDLNHQLQANHANWTTAFYNGDLLACRRYAQVGFELYDSHFHYPGMLRFGSHDAGACARYHLAKSNCLLGYPETSKKFSGEAIKFTRKLGHAGSLVIALNMEAIVQQIIGDVTAVKCAGTEFNALSNRHGMGRFAAAAPIIEGWVGVFQDEGMSAIDKMKLGVETLEVTGGLMRVPYYWGLLADAHRHVGNVNAALDAVDHGLRVAKKGGEAWYEPELHRLKGAMLLKETAVDEGIQCLETALDLARKKSAKWFELRTTTSLAAYWADRGDRNEAKKLLEPIYGWFTEGFETSDLGNAKKLLEKLS